MSALLQPSWPFGVITLEGVSYLEKPQVFGLEVTITTANQVLTNQRLTLPGIADFLLKGLSRDILVPGPPPTGGWPAPGRSQSRERTFRFRLQGAEGSTWFFSGGLGVFDDRVISNLCFGNAQFPYPLIPPVPIHASGTLIYEIEDVGVYSNDPLEPIPTYPYTIHFGFHGSYLIPANEAGLMFAA